MPSAKNDNWKYRQFSEGDWLAMTERFRLSRGLPFKVDANWTPEQALAVWELLDDLRDRVGTHYGLAMQNLMREQRVTHQPLDDFDQDMLL